MNRVAMKSSNIKEVGFESTSGTLEILFLDGGLYKYLHVPESVYSGLLRAPSAGKYFHTMIRDKYECARIN